jgi:putative ABC transport system permease protein
MLLKLLFRNTFRHKLRTGLTVCGISVAILAFGLLRTVIEAWYAGVSASSANRLIIRNAISLVFPLPFSYRDKIRSVEDVKIVTYGNWFGGIYLDKKNFFANFAVEARTYLDLYPEFVVPVDQKERFIRDRKGCIVGRKLANRFGWKIGDTIPLMGTIFPGNWPFILRAIYHGRDDTTDETQFFFHWDYLNEVLKKTRPLRADKVGFYIVQIDRPEVAARTAQEIDRLFKNSPAETLTETEKAFQMGFVSMSDAILTAIRLVSFVVIVIIMAVVANTMAMSVRERMGEYAVFKTLGFGGSYIAALILGESELIAAMGGGTGILLTFPAAKAFASALQNFIPVFKVTHLTILMDMGAAVLVGGVAGVLPIWRAATVRIAEGLGRMG